MIASYDRTGDMSTKPPTEVTSLAGGLEPLAAYIDANAGRQRFIALLSPT